MTKWFQIQQLKFWIWVYEAIFPFLMEFGFKTKSNGITPELMGYLVGVQASVISNCVNGRRTVLVHGLQNGWVQANIAGSTKIMTLHVFIDKLFNLGLLNDTRRVELISCYNATRKSHRYRGIYIHIPEATSFALAKVAIFINGDHIYAMANDGLAKMTKLYPILKQSLATLR